VRDVRTNTSSLLRAALAGVSLVWCASGCARWPVYFGPDLRRPAVNPEATEIVYRLDASQLHVPVAVARVEGQLVSYNEVAHSVLPDRTTGTLKIVYPCPDAPAGFARAEVQVTADPLPAFTELDNSLAHNKWLGRFAAPRKPVMEAVRETWALDLPKAELDQLLGALAKPGCVTVANPGEMAGGNITTLFSTRRSSGDCRPISELDALMRRVRNEGQLVAYTNPLSARGKMAGTPPSVVAYREWHGDEGSGVQVAQTGLSMPCPAPSGRILAVRPAGEAPARR
jgi:hypothetical protein